MVLSSWQDIARVQPGSLWLPCGIKPLKIFALWLLSSSIFYLSIFLFFLAYTQPSQIGCLPYFHTRCGFSASLGCRSETCCTPLAGKAVWAPSHNFVGLYLRN